MVEVAESGTLYITEVSELSETLQQKLVELIVDRKFHRLGEVSPHESGVRVILASTQEVGRLKAERLILPELERLLRPSALHIEPLRERIEDIPHFVDAFIEESVHRYGKEPVDITDEALDALARYLWPGNVSELESVIDDAVRQTRPQPIDEAMLPASIIGHSSTLPCVRIPSGGADFYQLTGRYEQALIEAALRVTNGNQRRAAALLNLKETTLAAMLKRIRYSVGKKARKA
jgi:DNA-binding NtrC family response regulator